MSPAELPVYRLLQTVEGRTVVVSIAPSTAHLDVMSVHVDVIPAGLPTRREAQQMRDLIARALVDIGAEIDGGDPIAMRADPVAAVYGEAEAAATLGALQ